MKFTTDLWFTAPTALAAGAGAGRANRTARYLNVNPVAANTTVPLGTMHCAELPYAPASTSPVSERNPISAVAASTRNIHVRGAAATPPPRKASAEYPRHWPRRRRDLASAEGRGPASSAESGSPETRGALACSAGSPETQGACPGPRRLGPVSDPRRGAPARSGPVSDPLATQAPERTPAPAGAAIASFLAASPRQRVFSRALYADRYAAARACLPAAARARLADHDAAAAATGAAILGPGRLALLRRRRALVEGRGELLSGSDDDDGDEPWEIGVE